MKAKIVYFLIVCALFKPSEIYAQISSGGFPTEVSNTLKAAHKIPVIKMPKADFKVDSGRGPLCGNVFAHKFIVDIDLKKEADLTRSGDYNIWRLGVKSENAYSLNLILKDFNVPNGARLFLYSPGKEQMKGAYTKANNTPHNFAISPIDGEEIVIDYEEPVNADFNANIIIKSVNHDFKGLKTLPAYGASEACHINAAKDTIHLNKRSACELIIDGSVYCSGNLINNTNQDGNPYIVTSSHCYWWYDSAKDVYHLDTSLVHTTIAFFNYETPSEAWDIEGSREMSLSGATTIATRKTIDMMLIKMDNIPPVDYRPYYAGWNHESYVKGPVYTFHHPFGDVKKISKYYSNPVTESYDSSNLFFKKSHWRIEMWNEGWTQGGSSGCGLFDSEDFLVGGLTGGNTNSSCKSPGDDYFWQFAKVWNDSTNRKNLGFWLDPSESGVTTLNGFQPYNNPCRRITHRAYNETPSEATMESDNKNYIVGSNAKGITEFAEKFTINQKGTLYGVYFFPIVGTYNAKNPVILRIYKGGDSPDSLVYEQNIRIQTKQYNYYKDQISTEDTRNWGGMENYVRLKTPVKLDSTFFVSFSVPSSSTPFALYFSDPKKETEQNSAFYLGSTKKWRPFTEHPTLKAATSLMVDVVLRDGWDNIDSLNPEPLDPGPDPEPEPEYRGEIQFYPTFTTGELSISIPKGDVLTSVQVVDMSGRTLLLQDNLNITSEYSFDVSNICMQSNVYNVIAKFKYANSKTFRFIKWRTDSTK